MNNPKINSHHTTTLQNHDAQLQEIKTLLHQLVIARDHKSHHSRSHHRDSPGPMFITLALRLVLRPVVVITIMMLKIKRPSLIALPRIS